MKDIFGYSFLKILYREFLVIAQLNVILTLIKGFDASQDGRMMSKANA